jgi:hypothetical protein
MISVNDKTNIIIQPMIIPNVKENVIILPDDYISVINQLDDKRKISSSWLDDNFLLKVSYYRLAG